MIALIIIIVSIVVAYVLYNKKKRSVSNSKNTRRIGNKSALPKLYVSKTSQRKQAPTYSVTKTSNSVGTHAREVASVETPSAGKDVGTGTHPVDVGTGTTPVGVGTIPDREPKNTRASVGVQTAAPVEPAPVEPPPSPPDIINVNELPSVNDLIKLEGSHVILTNPSKFKEDLQAKIKEAKTSEDNLSPIVESIITLLLSISEYPTGTINFSQTPPSIMTNVPADRIARATERFDSKGHTENIKRTLENFATTENLEGYKSVLQSASKYVEDYINIYIEPEMTVRSIVNIYEPKPSKLPFIIDHDTIKNDQKKYGRFNTVLQTKESDIYNIDYDAAQIKDGKHIVYAGYGYSGSGKTYTLLDSDNGVLKRLTDKLGYDGSFRNLSFQFLEIYNELDEKYRLVKGGLYRNYFLSEIDSKVISDNLFEGVQPKSIEFDNAKSLNDFITRLNEEYRTNWENYDEFNDGVRRPRVRITPNNPKSSRAHLIINVIDANDEPLFTILDMGGSEDVEAIKKLYYESKRIQPARILFTKDFHEILSELNNLQNSQVKKTNMRQISKFDNNVIKLLSDSEKATKKIKHVLTSFLDTNYLEETDIVNESIKANQWKEVIDKNEKFTEFFVHDEHVVHYIHAFSLVEQLLNVKFKPRNQRQEVFHAHVRILNKIIEKVNKLEEITLPLVDPIHSDWDENRKLNQDNFIKHSSYRDYVSQKIKQFDIHKILKDGLAHKALNEELRNKLPHFITYLKTRLHPGDERIDSKFDMFKKDIIRRYHTPLEQQGNYINRSIKQFQEFSLGVSKKQLAKNNDFSKVLGINESSVNKSEVKLVIFTCIKHEDYEDETKKDALDQSIKRSLEFAHCVNPLKSVEKDYHVCLQESVTDIQKAGRGSPQIALSKRSVESLQRLGMFNLVKAIRYKYYEQNRSKFQHDIVLLTDRIATLALTIVLLTLTEDAVALGVMFDQIVCTSLLNYNNDRKMLLLPVYLPFI